MKTITALLTGAALLGATAPAFADDFPGRAIREGVADIDRDRQERGQAGLAQTPAAGQDQRDDNRDDRRQWRDERRDPRPETRTETRTDTRTDRSAWRDDRRDWRDDRRDDRHWDRRDDRRDRWDDRRDDRRYGYSYGYDRGYRYGWDRWDGRWTPFGFGYYDRATSLWAYRYFDSNRNGRLSEREWRKAQRAFYRLADRNRDGYIDRREYFWATDFISRGYSYRW